MPSTCRTIILTRPGDKNRGLMTLLQQDGHSVVVAPALDLQSLALDPEAVPSPDDFDLVMFVSGYAAFCYLDACVRRASVFSWPAKTRAACVGAATAATLQNSGYVPASCIVYPESSGSADLSRSISYESCSPVDLPVSQGNDSEALWQTLQPILPGLERVLIVRGETGRDWLAGQFCRSGVAVTTLKMYRRSPSVWNLSTRQAVVRAFQCSQGPVVVLTSRESVDAFFENLNKKIAIDTLERTIFIVIHPRVADHLLSVLQRSGMVRDPVVKLSSPGDNALFQAIRAVSSPASNS